jgi:hypothetical protein
VATVAPFTDEQARALLNLEQQYGVWMAAEQTLAELPYDLRRKDVGGRSYLYEIHDRAGYGRSLGPWSQENEAKFTAYREAKAATKARREVSGKSLNETARLCRALRVPMLASAAGPILREADRRRLLGRDLLVVGTNAMTAYAIEAGGFIRDAPDETLDFDMAWSASDVEQDGDVVWRMLKSVDATFTVNSERPFQARNDKAYEVEILVAPSRAVTMSRLDRPRPVALPEQEWLLAGPCRRPRRDLPRRHRGADRGARSPMVRAQAVDVASGQAHSPQAAEGSEAGHGATRCRVRYHAAISPRL